MEPPLVVAKQRFVAVSVDEQTDSFSFYTVH
jgi:hypothetical protein